MTIAYADDLVTVITDKDSILLSEILEFMLIEQPKSINEYEMGAHPTKTEPALFKTMDP